MIVSERSFCIYCRGELVTPEDVSHEYHSTCCKELVVNIFDFELYSPDLVDNFKKVISKKKMFIASLMVVVSIIAFSLMTWFNQLNYFYEELLVALLFGAFLFYCVLAINQILKMSFFCKVATSIKPQYIYLSEQYCIAFLGDIKIISNTSVKSLFQSLCLVKFLESDTIEPMRLKLPVAPTENWSFNNKLRGLKFAKVKQIIEVPFNQYKSQRGVAVLYFLTRGNLKKHLHDLPSLIYGMNREEINFDQKYQKIPALAIILPMLGMVLAYFFVHFVLGF